MQDSSRYIRLLNSLKNFFTSWKIIGLIRSILLNSKFTSFLLQRLPVNDLTVFYFTLEEIPRLGREKFTMSILKRDAIKWDSSKIVRQRSEGMEIWLSKIKRIGWKQNNLTTEFLNSRFCVIDSKPSRKQFSNPSVAQDQLMRMSTRFCSWNCLSVMAKPLFSVVGVDVKPPFFITNNNLDPKRSMLLRI